MIIRLHYFEGMQWDAICEQTGLSIRTLRNVKNAAVTALAGLYDLIQKDKQE